MFAKFWLWFKNLFRKTVEYTGEEVQPVPHFNPTKPSKHGRWMKIKRHVVAFLRPKGHKKFHGRSFYQTYKPIHMGRKCHD